MTSPDPGVDGTAADIDGVDDAGAVDAAAAALRSPGTSVSVLAVSRAGRVLAALSPDRCLPPASNAKLVTAGLALDRLGPEHRFETRLVADGDPADRELRGDLVLLGSGAPDLDTDDVATLADGMADRFDSIKKDLVLDGSVFTGPQLGPGWSWGDEQHGYGARSSAVALDRNRVTATLNVDGTGEHTSETDEASWVSMAPRSDCLTVDVTLDQGDEATLDARTDHDTGEIRVTGTVPAVGQPANGPAENDRTGTDRVEPDSVRDAPSATAPVPTPERHCGGVLERALAERGVTLDGRVRTANEPRTPGDSFAVTVRSAPVGVLVREMNVPSDNFVAAQLARTVAAEVGAESEASWEAWRGVVDDHLAALRGGRDCLRDGSGLSRYDRLSARTLVAHLQWAADRPWADRFFDSLPSPGEGTLESRLDGVDVRAKTGTLTGTRALSGVVVREGATDVLFCVLQYGLAEDDAGRDRQDRFVRALAGTGSQSETGSE